MLRSIRLAKKATKTSSAVTETIVLTALGLILGFWFTPDAAFFSVPGFTWLLVGPFLSGLRYGFAYALNSALFLIGLLWLASHYYSSWNADSFATTAMALLFFAVISGEFSNYWQRKVIKLQATSEYLDQRLGEVTNAFNMIKVSHDRLAQQAASTNTLLDSILAVRSQIMKADLTETNITGLAALILKIFADYTFVQQAGFYVLNETGSINIHAVASLGSHFEIHPEDLILQIALNTLKTTSLKQELATKEEHSNLLLLAIPLVDVKGKLWGIVLVNKMPFRAFTPDNFRLSAILAGHIADLIGMRIDSCPLEDTDLQCFMLQVERCMHDVKAFSIPASLICIQLESEMQVSTMSASILEHQRGLDCAWKVINNSAIQCLFIVLPLTDLDGAEGYRVRVQQMLKENYGVDDLKNAGINFYKRDLASNTNVQELLLNYFQQLNVDPSLLESQNFR